MNGYKLRQFTFLLISVVLVSRQASASPCEYYDSEQLSIMPDNKRQAYLEPCSSSLFTLPEQPHTDDIIFSSEQNPNWTEDKSTTDSEFWKDWTKDADSPFLTEQAATTFYGLGVWLPEQYDEQEIITVEDAEEWLINHGLQMSFGIGGKDPSSPKFRFDYRWHDEEDDKLFLQLKVPFQ